MIGAKRKWLSGSRSFSAGLCCCVEYFFIFIFFPFFFVLGVGDKNVSLYVSFAFGLMPTKRSIKLYRHSEGNSPFAFFTERERAFSFLIRNGF